MYHYSSPPPGWSAYEYTTSPPTSPHYVYYSSQYASPHASPRGPSKRHNRKASYAGPRESAGWFSGYQSQSHYEAMPEYATPPRKHEHVSASFGGKRTKCAPRRFSTSGTRPFYGCDYYDEVRPSRSQKRSIFVDVTDDAREYVYVEPSGARPSRGYYDPETDDDGDDYYQSYRYSSSTGKPRPATDHYYTYQVPVFDETDTPRRSRARRASTSTRTPQKPKPSASSKSPPKATEEDARRKGIPPGYSTKNWDPTEEPIILLGSVFDANSLGKWIYDWTVFHLGAATPMAEVAGDLWLLLIKLAGKMKRAEECVDRIYRPDAREMVEDFIKSGARLWARFERLLKSCEHFMWKAAKREGGKGPMSMGRNAGCEFVDTIFGRDRELENTEKLMNSVRLWNMRFDANCDGILRRPSTA
ncbi:hypothetical protein DTO063F5_8587 [Paecilomyces variotii]|nr:hypothetical protein DTO063F5_8587 [Paecilomyces variotii]